MFPEQELWILPEFHLFHFVPGNYVYKSCLKFISPSSNRIWETSKTTSVESVMLRNLSCVTLVCIAPGLCGRLQTHETPDFFIFFLFCVCGRLQTHETPDFFHFFFFCGEIFVVYFREQIIINSPLLCTMLLSMLLALRYRPLGWLLGSILPTHRPLFLVSGRSLFFKRPSCPLRHRVLVVRLFPSYGFLSVLVEFLLAPSLLVKMPSRPYSQTVCLLLFSYPASFNLCLLYSCSRTNLNTTTTPRDDSLVNHDRWTLCTDKQDL